MILLKDEINKLAISSSCTMVPEKKEGCVYIILICFLSKFIALNVIIIFSEQVKDKQI